MIPSYKNKKWYRHNKIEMAKQINSQVRVNKFNYLTISHEEPAAIMLKLHSHSSDTKQLKIRTFSKMVISPGQNTELENKLVYSHVISWLNK